MDERSHTVCCQWADDDQLRYEADTFNCQTCPVAQATEALYPENMEAWQVFQKIARRLVVDAHLAPLVMTAATADMTPSETLELLERMDLIYDVVVPRPTNA